MKPYFETKLGELYNGDCLEVMKEMPILDIKLILTDPPYGMKLKTDWTNAVSSKKMQKEKHIYSGKKYDPIIGDDVDFNPIPIMEHFKNVKKQLWFGADYYCQRIEKISQGSWLVWDKRITASVDKMYGSCFELIWSKQKHKRKIYRIKWAGIFGIEKQDIKKRVHPNQKPLKLICDLLKDYSKEGDLIFDPFLGSGTTAVACERLNRRWIGVEISRRYCDIAVERLRRETAQNKFDFS